MVRSRASGVSNHDFVMPGLVPGIHVFRVDVSEDVDGRNKSGHDGARVG
jgi:hypothetical protein